MKKILFTLFGCLIVLAAQAVPAPRGWQTITQADGSTIELRLIGDEFYHVTLNRDGQVVRCNDQGMYEVVGAAPSVQQLKARHAKAKARRQRMDVGMTPNLAPRGVVIVANFADSKMQSGHTQATFDELCNAVNCTVNDGYPSAAQYFADQSNGSYRPLFDVFGVVNLTRNTAYYGKDIEGGEAGYDEHAADAVVEACILADEQFDINWADYDSDNDGLVDFVYLIYAGQGQANGGSTNTIWPHNWDIESALTYYIDGDEEGLNGTVHYCTYTAEQCTLGGKRINNYACSSELTGRSLGGIGTLCHEFGHVIGLPDLYDIEYGTIYERDLTPGDWNVMDAGSYNGNGHCPPNYDPWQKYFFGWVNPINPGNAPAQLTLQPNGKEGYQTYQLNASGELQGVTSPGLCYFIENRQQQGWDKPLPGHGMLIWRINFDADIWTANAPNASSTKGAPRYSVDGPYPSSGSSWRQLSDKPLLEIKENDGVISLFYIDDLSDKTVTWMVNGEVFETKVYAGDGSEDLVLPTQSVPACDAGIEFVGWTTETEWYDPFSLPEDLFTEPSGKVVRDVTYTAVFVQVTKP